jgi:hypothetical protein
MDTDPDAPVHIEKGLTTFTTKTDTTRPYNIFKTPKFVRTMHDLQIGDRRLGALERDRPVAGQLQDAARSSRRCRTAPASRGRRRSSSPAGAVAVSADPPPLDGVEYVSFDYALAFGRSVEQVLNTITVA